MKKSISLALCAGGFMLIVYGVSASDSCGADLFRFFTDAPADRAMWLLIGGVAAELIGASGLLGGSKSY